MQRSLRTLTAAAAAAAAAAVAVTGAGLVAAPASASRATVLTHAGELTRYGTHLPTALPEGATARVHSVATGSGKTVVTLTLKGARPDTQYGAHAHTNPCGPTPAAAGPHFQLAVDPVSPSTNPAYANPDNEIWLDLTTDAAGEGTATTVVDWRFPHDRRAQSVIIHVEHTHTGPHDSGFAGARLGCLTVPF